MDRELFFLVGERNEVATRQAAVAKAICACCPVRAALS
jgi:hypothetical protein